MVPAKQMGARWKQFGMPYAKGRKQQIRNRIIEQASYGLREHGGDGLSVPELMKLSGMTHGGFYGYFPSREALVTEAVGFAMDQTADLWKQLANGSATPEQFDAFVSDYLSFRHRDDVKQGCAIAALAADVRRSSQKTRRAFGRKLEELVDLVTVLFPEEPPQQARQAAVGMIATLVGSIILSRVVTNENASNDILDAGRQSLRRSKPKRRKIVSDSRDSRAEQGRR